MAPSSFSIPKPPVSQPVLILNRAFHTVLELIDPGNSKPPIVALRPIEHTRNQLWIFDGRNQSRIQNATTKKYIALNGADDWTTKDQAQALQFDVTQSRDGTISLSFKDSASNTNKFVKPDSTGLALTSGINVPGLENQLFYIVDISATLGSAKSSPSKSLVPPYPRGYRIRSYDGWSVLTAPDSNDPSSNAGVYADKQDTTFGSRKQQWIVAQVPSGNFTIQSVATQRYIGPGAGAAKDGDRLVASSTAFEWEIKDAGGFFWSIRVPKQDLSLGVPSMEVRHGDKITVVESDYTPSQLWFIEKYRQVGNELLQPVSQNELPAGKYLLRSGRDEKCYFAVDMPNIISSPSSFVADEFVLEYKPNSGRCLIKFYSTAFQSWYYVGRSQSKPDEAGLTSSPQELIILKGNDSDYLICLADISLGKPRQVISNETRLSGFGDMFLIQGMSESPGLASISLMWRFIHT